MNRDRACRRGGVQLSTSFKVVVIILILTCFQDIRIIDFETFALKPFHLAVLMALVYSMASRKREWELPGKLFLCGLLAILAISLIDYMRYGFRSEFLNYIFMYLMCAALYNVGKGFTIAEWKRAVQIAAFFVMAAIYVKLAVNIGVIIEYFRHTWGNHPIIPTFLGGGVNLEASWMALFIVFFDKNFKGYVYAGMAFALSMAYASRAGMIICVLAVMYLLVIQGADRRVAMKFAGFVAVAVFVFAVLAANDNVLVNRFLETGKETGSVARLTMWSYANLAFEASPIFGCGAGNATTVMSELSGTTILESNVHLYALQVLLDFGLVGFFVFVAMVVSFLRNCWKTRLLCPFSAWILIYLIASFIQFRGGDVLLGVALAGYFQAEKHVVCRSASASASAPQSASL